VRTAGPLIEEHPNVIVMRTFSKAHALAGVRVGYAIGDPEVIGAIQALLVPFGVSSLALAAALASLKDAEGVQRAVAEIIAEREQQVWGRPGQTTPEDCHEPSAREPEEPAGPGDGSSGSSVPADVGPTSSAPGDAPESPTTPAITWSFGSVEVTSQVTGYQRMALPGGEVVSQHALEMDEHVLPTAAVWWTIPQEVCEAAGLEPADLPGALHAAEHASIGMLPLLATCDRWDIGGLSTAMHSQTGAPTVFVHDGHAGGAARCWACCWVC